MGEKTFIKKNNKVLVVYLISKFDNPLSFKYFLINYQKYNPRHKHKLLICFKKLDKKKYLKYFLFQLDKVFFLKTKINCYLNNYSYIFRNHQHI